MTGCLVILEDAMNRKVAGICPPSECCRLGDPSELQRGNSLTFSTPIVIAGPLRNPRQMLAQQLYQGHQSIHDDSTAEAVGFRAGPIEGPTHFSLVPPFLAHLWGQD
jgi:hypothetical protein